MLDVAQRAISVRPPLSAVIGLVTQLELTNFHRREDFVRLSMTNDNVFNEDDASNVRARDATATAAERASDKLVKHL